MVIAALSIAGAIAMTTAAQVACAAPLRWEPLAQSGCGGPEVARAAQGGATVYVVSVRGGRFAGVGKSADGRRTWTLLEGPVRGLPNAGTSAAAADVHCLPDMPEVAWVLACGTLFRTSDGGARFAPVGGTAGLTALTADPANPGRMFVGGPEGVGLCTDGLSFQFLPGSPAQATRLLLVPGPGFLLYAVRRTSPGGGLYRSARREWTLVRGDPAIADVAVDPRDPKRLAVVTAGRPGGPPGTGAWVSGDAGATWARAATGLPGPDAVAIRFDPRDPERLLLATEGKGCFATRWPRRRSRGVATVGGG